MLVAGYTTPLSIILTVLIGVTVAYGTLYTVGSPNVRPTGQTLLAGLRHVGFHPVSARRAEAGVPETAEQGDRGRRYIVTLEEAHRSTSPSSTGSSRRTASSTGRGAG